MYFNGGEICMSVGSLQYIQEGGVAAAVAVAVAVV
jgi:hypothetical protein